MSSCVKKMAMYFFFGVFGMACAYADTVGNYMTIVHNIPSMSMKPDEQSQAWSRSARSILTSTDETMAQTIVSMNSLAAKQGKPIFCFSPGVPFDAAAVDDLIQKTYAELVKTQGTSVATMPVSDVLMIGMSSKYGCTSMPAQATPSAAPIQSAVQSMPQAATASIPGTLSALPAATQPSTGSTSLFGEQPPTQVSVSADSQVVL